MELLAGSGNFSAAEGCQHLVELLDATVDERLQNGDSIGLGAIIGCQFAQASSHLQRVRAPDRIDSFALGYGFVGKLANDNRFKVPHGIHNGISCLADFVAMLQGVRRLDGMVRSTLQEQVRDADDHRDHEDHQDEARPEVEVE